MKNILVLTKREQRVIAIVLALLAGRIAKYEWAAHSQPLRLNPTETAAMPPAAQGRNESESADETQ